MSGVNKRTAMLVTDEPGSGTRKNADAAALGVRVVAPEVFEVLLRHLQPARSGSAARTGAARPAIGSHGIAATIGTTTLVAAGGALTETSVAVAEVQSDNGPSVGSPGASPAAIRAWARLNGHDIGHRGRVPSEVVDAYHRAHPSD